MPEPADVFFDRRNSFSARTFGRWSLGLLLILGGIGHFINPDMYLRIMPPYIPFHHFCIAFSGLAEIVIGALLLIPRTVKAAAWGAIALFIAIFPANVYLYQHQDLLPLPPLLHLLRLPLQGVFIWWAYIYTSTKEPTPIIEKEPSSV